MKKFSMIFLGCFLLLSGAIELQAMELTLGEKLNEAEENLNKQNLNMQGLLRDIANREKKLVLAEQELRDAQGAYNRYPASRPIIIDQNLIFAQTKLKDLKRDQEQANLDRNRLGNSIKSLQSFIDLLEAQQRQKLGLGAGTTELGQLAKERESREKQKKLDKEAEQKKQEEERKLDQEKATKQLRELALERKQQQQPQEQPEQQQLEQQPQQELSKQKIPLLPKKWFGIGATAAAVFAAGALYASLKWYQKKQIRRVLAKYELDLTMLSPTQRDAMAAAFRASYSVPGALRSLRLLSRKSQFVSREVPAEVMWNMVAEIYYKKSPTPKEVQDFKIYVG